MFKHRGWGRTHHTKNCGRGVRGRGRKGRKRWGGPPFGVKRPLRFLTRTLELNEDQTGRLAAVIDDLKTERAQARVDHRRALAEFAKVFGGDEFDRERIKEATSSRAKSAERVQEAVATALEKTWEVLEPEQRKKLAYLMRSGAVTI